MSSPVAHYMLQPSGGGDLLPDGYGAESRRHCVSVPHTKKKKWPLFMKRWRNAVRPPPLYYEDEVEIHLTPKIGADWQLREQQKRVATPGQNEKYYLADALHSGTGKVSYVGGNSKSSSLFIILLKHIEATYRWAKTITLIVDNYIIHKNSETLC